MKRYLKQVIHFTNSIDYEKLQMLNCVESVSLTVKYRSTSVSLTVKYRITPVYLKLASLNNMNNSEQD